MKKYLAFIEPLEDFRDKEEAYCQIRIMSGDLKFKVFRQLLKTTIFNFYFWGTTFEVVYIENGVVIKVEDLHKDTMEEFSITVDYAVTYNAFTHEVLTKSGFLHNLDDSLFARNCKPILMRIYSEIATSYNFSMRFYLRKGAIISLLFDKNIDEKACFYKYVMQAGFVAADRNTMRSMIPKTQTDYDKNKKLNQEDIDRLFKEMSKV